MDTASLAGRPLTADDHPFLLRVWKDERVAPMIGGVPTEQQVHAKIKSWDRHRIAHGFAPVLFEERATGRPVGWGGLQHSSIGIGERLTLGYAIAPEAWRRGYATEIASAS